MKLNEVQLRRLIKNELKKIVILEETGTEGTEKIKLKDGTVVLLSSGTKKHISTHAEPGLGSVFAGGDFVEVIVDKISGLSVSGGGGVFSVDVPGVGYNLVMPYEEAKGLKNATETTVTKKERGSDVEVPAFKTSAPLEDFKTPELSIVIRPTKDAAYLPTDMKNDSEVESALDSGKLYSVLSAWPGGDVPPASQWGKNWAVVIPGQVGEKNESSFKKDDHLLIERWQRLAGLIK